MPHLSPMSWTVMLMLLWLTTLLFMALMFFSVESKFMKPMYQSNISKTSLWPWLLQDGRDMNNKL